MRPEGAGTTSSGRRRTEFSVQRLIGFRCFGNHPGNTSVKALPSRVLTRFLFLRIALRTAERTDVAARPCFVWSAGCVLIAAPKERACSWAGRLGASRVRTWAVIDLKDLFETSASKR